MRFGDYCNIKMGQAPRGEFYNNNGQGFPLLAGAGDLGEIYPNPSRFSSSAPRICSAGEIILCIRATIGKKNWADRSYCLGRGVASISPIDSEKVFLNYVWHWLTANERLLIEKGKGATFIQVNRKDIEDLPFSLPSISEQRRIAAILDKAEDIRRKRRQSIVLVDNFLKSVFLNMFGDPVKNAKGWDFGTIRDIVSETQYGTSSPSTENGEYVYLRMNNITYDGRLDLSSLKYITMQEKNFIKYSVQFGDILFNRTNSKELVGKTCVFKEKIPMIIAGYIIRVRTNNRAHPEYLSAFLNSAHGKKKLTGMCKSIIGQANINAQELKDIPILIPPRDLQNKFAKIVHHAEVCRKNLQLHLDEADKFFNCLQQSFLGSPCV